jgi:DNA repair exonuclease SbcCD nuclease subunit
MNQIKFIHSADIHLGTPFGTAATMPGAISNILREGPRKALETIIETAVSEAVDFVLIAGDIFDGPTINLRDLRFFTRQLEVLKEYNIPCCAICGNHDPLEIWPRHWHFPDNFFLFGPQIEHHTIHKNNEPLVDIIGFSYPGKEIKNKSLRGYKRQDAELPAIGMLHTAIAPPPNSYVPCSVDDLLECDLDFWALGHVHQRRDERSAGPIISWSGAPQKLNPNETGGGGFYLVESSGDGIFDRHFVPADSVRFAEMQLDVSDCPEIEQLPEYITNKIQAAVSEEVPVIVRAIASGRCSFSSEVRKGRRLEEIVDTVREDLAATEPCIHLDVLDLRLRGDYELEQLAGENSLPGDIAAALKSISLSPDEFAETANPCLDPLFFKWKNRKLLDAPDASELAELASEAGKLLLDRLLEDFDA